MPGWYQMLYKCVRQACTFIQDYVWGMDDRRDGNGHWFTSRDVMAILRQCVGLQTSGSVSPHRVSDMTCQWIGKAGDPSTVCVKLSVPTEQSVWIHSNTKNWDKGVGLHTQCKKLVTIICLRTDNYLSRSIYIYTYVVCNRSAGSFSKWQEVSLNKG